MEIRAIILAAGEQRRFQRDQLKQLLPICDGETFLSRMIRQCYDRGVSDIYVATHLREIAKVAIDKYTGILSPEDRTFTCSTILSSSNLWTDRNIILLGDVYFTKDTIDKIFYFPADPTVSYLRFFASVNEVFAFSFTTSYTKLLKHYLKEIIENAESQSGGKVRRLMEKFPSYWEEIHDETTDIDTAKEYDIFKRDVIHERKYKLTDRPT